MKRIVIIGGGLSGLSLACVLAKEKYEVLVLEKNPYLGGRASNTKDWTMHDAIPIGPHVFVTAYNNLRHFFHTIGATNTISWEKKQFIELIYQGKKQVFHTSSLPVPFKKAPLFFQYEFISWYDKIQNMRVVNRFLLATPQDIETYDHENAYQFLRRHGVTPNSMNKLWRFFALSMLNVPLELCSAGEFAMLMKHWALLKHDAFGFAKQGLGDEYTTKAKEYIVNHGGSVKEHTAVEEIVVKDTKIEELVISTQGKRKKITADIYVSTLPPTTLRTLLPSPVLFSPFFRHLNAFEPVPYISVNLWFDRKVTTKKFWALLDDSDTPETINTDFYDQSNIYESRKKRSFITSNIIYSKPYESMSDAQLVEKTLAELKQTFPHMQAKVIHSQVHRTPYVLYAPFPGMREHKLPIQTPLPNFLLAGDWTIKEMTQCMESAVRSGYKAAEYILKSDGKQRMLCDDRVH